MIRILARSKNSRVNKKTMKYEKKSGRKMKYKKQQKQIRKIVSEETNKEEVVLRN